MSELSKKQQIVSASDLLFYQRGYAATSFADIAEAVQISRGNFYYHFKSKDSILDAVISLRLANSHKLLRDWESHSPAATERIGCFINRLLVKQTDIMRYGCPVATLNTELAKLNHPAKATASMLSTVFRTWLRRQFCLLGEKSSADLLAVHLLSRSQGAATIANTFGEQKLLRQEVQLMHDWLRTCIKLPAGNISTPSRTSDLNASG